MSGPAGPEGTERPTWRRHQREALAAIARDDGSNHWIVLPPGAGKTLVGVETAARLGRPCVAFGPNRAIVAQWRDTWERHTGLPATSERSLPTQFTALTYQALATFSDSEEPTPGARLHPNGRALIERMHDAGPLTIILDECHHLLQVWGALLDEVLAELDDAIVIALTATPPELLSAAEAELVERLFGELTYQASIPALVAEGDLVPFAELAWFTTPTAREEEWLAARATRGRELVSELTRPGVASVGLQTWASLLRLGDVSEEVADAIVRLARAGHLPMPEDAHISERHHRPPDLPDWLAVASGWLLALRTGDPADQEASVRLAALLPGVGYRLTRFGIRPGQPLVDRVLSRSAAKAAAAVDIVAESLETDPQARLLVLTEHASAAALPADLDGVLEPESGSAQWVLAALLADSRTAAANPLLVTGATVAADPGALRAATEALASGATRVLVGTRALLGEGWDSRQVTGVVDLTSATTTTAIVQTRGRSLRTDPARPEKVAINWTVTCVAPETPQGGSDFARLVRKHSGWFSVDGQGDVVDGVAHLDDQVTPDAPPARTELAALNARALRRAADPEAVRAAWATVDPAREQPMATLRIRGTRVPAVVAAPAPTLAPITTVGIPSTALAASVMSLLVLPDFGWLVALIAMVVGGVAWARQVAEARSSQRAEPSITAYAAAVADSLHEAGLSPVGADKVVAQVTLDGETRVHLDGAPEAATQLFTRSLAETLGPIEQPRYLISRPVWNERGPRLRDALRRPRPDREAWHQVPSALGATRRDADLFAAHWRAHVGPGRAVFTGTPEGAGLVRALRWSSPIGDDAGLSIVQRRHW